MIPKIPLFDLESTCILYPHKNAKQIDELDEETIKKIKKVVAIDCTWNQTTVIIKN